MTYYIVRDVEPGTVASYRPGRTLLNEAHATADAAFRRAECYNHYCHTDGIRYRVVPHDDTQPFPCDYFENAPTRTSIAA